jgi:DNA-binding IclR family transcriptional regulator
MDECKDEVSTSLGYLIPMLIIEELVRSDRPTSVDEMSKSLDIAKTTLDWHCNALAKEGFIEAFGSQPTFVVSKRLVKLSANVLSM